MDATRFDRLVLMLTTAPTRRGIARALGGLSLAVGASALLGLTDTGAKKKKGKGKKKKKCKGATKKCGKRCIPSTSCCTDADCGSGETCQTGTCSCPPGQEDSGGVCATPPTCAGFRQPCLPGGCCGNVCSIDSGGFARCERSGAGQPCHADSDCFAIGPIVCRGFICTVP